MKKRSTTLHAAALALLLAFGALPSAQAQHYVGGDISLLPSYESHGAKYYDNKGNKIDNLLDFFKQEGWNAMRVRLFVDPSKASTADKGQGVVQNLDYVVNLAKRIKAAGFSLMLDFHYSDSWADPAKQWTPQAWQNLGDAALAQQLHDYTAATLQTLIDAGATPDFIQTGNEISYGLCWGSSASNAKYAYPDDRYSVNWARFATLLQSAIRACREKCPQAKIVLHTERVAPSPYQTDNTNYAALKYWLNKMSAANIDFDIVGLSYYPYYHGPMEGLDRAISTVESLMPSKKVMIVETGYTSKYKINGSYDYSSKYPGTTEAGQQAFTADLIMMLRKHASVDGLYWWWPEANENGLDWNTKRVTDSWYNASLFDNSTGRATAALSTLKTFTEGVTAVELPSYHGSSTPDSTWYTLNGQRVERPTHSGIYVKKGKKVVVK